MLKLYDARSRLMHQKQKGVLRDVPMGSDLVLSHLTSPLIILPGSLDVKSAYTQIADSAVHAFLVTQDEHWIGIVRRESLEILQRTTRSNALQLPLTSIMLRSFILISDTSTLIEAAEEFVHRRALGAIVVSEDGAPINVISVDWLESCLKDETSRILGARVPALEAHQA